MGGHDHPLLKLVRPKGGDPGHARTDVYASTSRAILPLSRARPSAANPPLCDGHVMRHVGRHNTGCRSALDGDQVPGCGQGYSAY
jgi:hypothetical protein